MRSAESFRTCPDEKRLSKQDESRAPPFFKATDFCARTLDDSRYLLLRFSFGQRLLASQYSSMIRRTFTMLHVLFDFLRSAFHLFRYLPENIRIWEAAVFRMGSRGRGIPTRTPCLL